VAPRSSPAYRRDVTDAATPADRVADQGDARWLGSRFSLTATSALRPVARGAVGRVYRLTTTAGVFAAKEYFWWERDERQLADVAAFVERCRAAGVDAPALIGDPSGQIVHVHPGTGRSWTLQEWSDGQPPASSTDLETARWLMRQAAAMHRLAAPAGPYPDAHWYCRVDLDWSDVADRARSAGARWGEALASRRVDFEELTAFVNGVEIGPTVMAHRDLKPDNTLRGVRGWSLIDWDNAGPHEPWREVGTTLLHHLGSGAGDELTLLVREYRDAGGAPLPDDATVFASGVAIWLNFLRAQAELSLDGSHDAEHRSFADERVPGLIAGIATMTVLGDEARMLRRRLG
jgi:Ser/Thr protein kinase RdoA (MazF antagonist)